MSAFADGNCSQSACASFSRGCTDRMHLESLHPPGEIHVSDAVCSDMGAGSQQRTQQRYRRPILSLVLNRLESIVEEAAVDSSIRDYLASGSTLGEGWEGRVHLPPIDLAGAACWRGLMGRVAGGWGRLVNWGALAREGCPLPRTCAR